jgi:hypothetical protein
MTTGRCVDDWADTEVRPYRASMTHGRRSTPKGGHGGPPLRYPLARTVITVTSVGTP